VTRITVAAGSGGTLIHTNTVIKTGETLSYVLVPKAQLNPGDTIQAMRVFGRGSGGVGKGVDKRTEPSRVLTPPIIADFPNGSFVRMREAP
jgi:hypothetical protein